MVNRCPFRCLSLVLILVGFATSQSVKAASFSNFRGKYTGVLIISQGADTRIAGNANVSVSPKGKFTIKGVLNSVAFTQVINLRRGGVATVSSLLPGIATFSQNVIGSYRGKKKRISVSGLFSRTSPGSAPGGGTLQMKIDKTTFDSTISISTKVSFKSGNTPVYVTIVAS